MPVQFGQNAPLARTPAAAASAISSHGELPLRLMRGDATELWLDGSRCSVMAILNVTPDSFFDGGRYAEPTEARDRAFALVEAGADILDIGAESTRPGATLLTADEEWRRLAPILEPLGAARLPAVLSIDTRHAEVAARAHKAGVRLLNLPFPQHLIQPVAPDAKTAAPSPAELRRLLESFDAVVVMHARGTPNTMRDLTDYRDNLCQTVIDELRNTVTSLLGGGDVPVLRSRLIYDPGLGFAKTSEQSLRLLSRIGWLRRMLGGKLLIGASRKSMLGAISNLPVNQRLIPSIAAAALAAYQGADIVRVHDVAESISALRVANALRQAALAEGG